MNYTTPDNDQGTGRKQAIVEYTFNPNNLSQVPTEKTIMLIDYPQQNTHHRAGWLDFGPDGMLYIATGEDTVASNAQTVVNQNGSINHLGKMLRIDVSGDDFPADANRSYRIPADNPTEFDKITGELAQPSEIWAVGLRNPWRACFGPDGKLYVADVGQNTYEEINIVEAGKNYGWRVAPVADGPQNTPGYTDPYHYYGRDIGGSVTGGYFYSGQGPLNGKYIFGDFNNGHIFAMDVSGAEAEVEDITNLFRDANGNPMQFGHLSSFGLDGQGNLYAISYADNTWGNDTGRVFRLSDNTPVEDVGDDLNGAGGNDTIYGGGGDDTIHGGDDNDHLYGDAGNDHLYGDDGVDTLEGGADNDTYYVDNGDSVVEATGNGIDEILVKLQDNVVPNFVLQAGQEVERLRAEDYASERELNITGNEFDQMLEGNDGDNRIDGKAGADTMIGSNGDDTYVVDDADDTVIEIESSGTDTVESTINYTLGADLENLVLRGNAIKGTGNILYNVITGNGVANILDGKGGQDTLIGRGGNDTYWISDGREEIVETAGEGTDTVIVRTSGYMLTGGADVEILKADEDSEVSELIGNEVGNTLIGNKGDNYLNGAGGSDTVVFKGKRSDYTIERVATGFQVKDNVANRDGTDTVVNVEFFQFADRTVNLEGLLNTPPSSLKLDANAVMENSNDGKPIGDFSVDDNSGDRHTFTLVNSAGGRFSLDSNGKLSVADGVRLDYEQETQHTIEVMATDSFGESITSSFVIYVQDAPAEQATGSAGADVMKGGSGNDSFNGLGGNDRIEADLGNDTLMGGSENDTLDAGGGNDRVLGEMGNDSLIGGLGNDLLDGSLGNDRLVGGLGKDTMTGGTGRDVFVFDDRETGSSKSKADYIIDFSGRSGDRLDLRAVDANTKKSGDQNFSFIGKKAFSKAGEVRYEKTKSATYVYLNTDNDKAAEAVIKLKGSIDLSKSWFVL
ncbi:Ca2+-binding RTX toxin-like protein [Microvirga lupini]|uniref:Ca2+-binding RTX toxin-like protein n=1 Tax=Microvirga lupini TaxID=420324 RepID=A0A7W4VIP9_9HYPH|nr:Ca2+-binding RTX toxin-like protein [Microvirga lupini]